MSVQFAAGKTRVQGYTMSKMPKGKLFHDKPLLLISYTCILIYSASKEAMVYLFSLFSGYIW